MFLHPIDVDVLLEAIEWDWREITAEHVDGRKAFMAMCYKGLAYHPQSSNQEGADRWVLTHIASGLGLGFGGERYGEGYIQVGQRFSFREEDKAAEFLLAIADICDWTLDLPALARSYNSDLVRYEVYQVYLRMED